MVREQAIICTANGYNIFLTFVSVWILWLDVLLIINGYLLSLSVWCFQGTFPDVLPEWRWGDSNPWPPACKAGALPTELHPHIGFGYWLNFNQSLMWFYIFSTMGLNGLEPSTSRLSGVRSNQLSYKPVFLLIWRPPILPHRLQCSTFGRLRLNRRVRDGYGCFP